MSDQARPPRVHNITLRLTFPSGDWQRNGSLAVRQHLDAIDVGDGVFELSGERITPELTAELARIGGAP